MSGSPNDFQGNSALIAQNESRWRRMPADWWQAADEIGAWAEVRPVATAKVDQFVIHLQPDVAEKCPSSSCPALCGPQNANTSRIGSARAIQHGTATHFWLPAQAVRVRSNVHTEQALSRPEANSIARTARQMSALMSSGTADREPTSMLPSSLFGLMRRASAARRRRFLFIVLMPFRMSGNLRLHLYCLISIEERNDYGIYDLYCIAAI